MALQLVVRTAPDSPSWVSCPCCGGAEHAPPVAGAGGAAAGTAGSGVPGVDLDALLRVCGNRNLGVLLYVMCDGDEACVGRIMTVFFNDVLGPGLPETPEHEVLRKVLRKKAQQHLRDKDGALRHYDECDLCPCNPIQRVCMNDGHARLNSYEFGLGLSRLLARTERGEAGFFKLYCECLGRMRSVVSMVSKLSSGMCYS